MNTRVQLLLLLPISLLLLAACDNSVLPTDQTESTVEVLETFSEPEAFLADEQNTVDVVNTFGPSVVAINVGSASARI
jgi:hypothetical protein